MTTHGRIIPINQVVLDQADFFQLDGFTRVAGLLPAALIGQVFFDNSIQPWPVVTGLGVADSQVSSGRLYFNEVPGLSGFYNVRFRPTSLGYWRVLLTYAAGFQIVGQDYDVVSSAPAVSQGLSASLIGTADCGVPGASISNPDCCDEEAVQVAPTSMSGLSASFIKPHGEDCGAAQNVSGLTATFVRPRGC